MRLELGAENTLFVHVTLVPFIAAAGELKTKPTQHSVKEMLSIGIQPDILLCRSDHHIPAELDRKSTRLNSSHITISYAVFCLKKKKNTNGHFAESNQNQTYLPGFSEHT